MADVDLIVDPEQRERGGVPRRTFIKGVIAAGAAVSSAGYLFRSSGVFAQAAAQGAVERLITLKTSRRAMPRLEVFMVLLQFQGSVRATKCLEAA